jgi:hypothetical protein
LHKEFELDKWCQKLDHLEILIEKRQEW